MTRHGRVWGFAGSAGQRPGLGSLVAAATLGGMLLAGAQAALAAPVWVPTDKLAQPRANAVGILLQNGRVLAIGGSPTSQDTAELYDPTTGVWSAADVLGAGRQLFSAVLLRDGRVLVCGGRDKNPTILAACQTYDPVTEKWSNVTPMRVPREDFTLTLLDNGTFKGWARTGKAFNLFKLGTPGTLDVSRFFSTTLVSTVISTTIKKPVVCGARTIWCHWSRQIYQITVQADWNPRSFTASLAHSVQPFQT